MKPYYDEQGRKYLNVTDYGRFRGVSHQAVMKACDSGRAKFIEIDGRRWVDVLATQETWGENLNRLNDTVDAGPNVQKIYSEAKAKTQIFESKLKELEYQQTIGKLVNADEVKKEIINMSRTVRDAYLSLPARVAPLLAPITDPLEIDRILSEEIHKILENLVNANNR